MGILGLKSPLYISFLPFFLFNKVVLPQKSGFLLCFFIFLLSSCTTVWFSSSYCGAFWCVGDSNGKVDSIKTSSQIMVVSMLHNLSHMYYSLHRIIKCVGFKPIHCAINLDDASSSRVFSKFDSFLLDILLV